MKRYFSVLIGLFLFVSCFIWMESSQATLVKPLNIQQLTAWAHQIVKAQVVERQVADDPYESGTIACYYTLSVLDWIKGSTGSNEIVLKQLADGTILSNGQVLKQKFYLPKYEVGKTYVFFLPQASEQTGLSAPIGLEQGVFEVKTNKQGNETLPSLSQRTWLLKNNLGQDSRGENLKRQIDQAATQGDYQSFKSLVQKVLGVSNER